MVFSWRVKLPSLLRHYPDTVERFCLAVDGYIDGCSFREVLTCDMMCWVVSRWAPKTPALQLMEPWALILAIIYDPLPAYGNLLAGLIFRSLFRVSEVCKPPVQNAEALNPKTLKPNRVATRLLWSPAYT